MATTGTGKSTGSVSVLHFSAFPVKSLLISSQERKKKNIYIYTHTHTHTHTHMCVCACTHRKRLMKVSDLHAADSYNKLF